MQPLPSPNRLANREQRGPRYKVLRPLASGGMGNLYLARARGIEGFERLVVLKRLKPDVAGCQDNVRMFLDEVRVLASIQHTNVVHIYDVGVSTDASYFYSMEFLVGQDLRRLIQRGVRQRQTVPLPQALFIASSVLSGLHHVHQRLGPRGEPLKIVHRDVSPANIFITYEGGVKLIDFGIAKTSLQAPQTDQGVIKGKVRYVSPEQCRMEPIDARSDVFSLGVVLWEMTTGRGLFKSQNPGETLFAIAEKDAPRPSLAVADYPRDLEAVVMKALARKVNERWQSAREMQHALEELAVARHWPQSAFGLSLLMETRFAEEIAALRAPKEAAQELTNFAAEQLADVQPTPSGMCSRGVAPVKTAAEVIAAAPPHHSTGVTPAAVPRRSSRRARGRPLSRVTLFRVMGICAALGVGLGGGHESPRPPSAPVVVDAPAAGEVAPQAESTGETAEASPETSAPAERGPELATPHGAQRVFGRVAQ